MKKLVIVAGLSAIVIKSCDTKSQEPMNYEKLLTSAPWTHIITCENGKKIQPPAGRRYDFNKLKWNISADGKILSIIEAEKLGGASFPYEVEMLDANTLILKRVVDKRVVTEIYEH